MHNLLCAVIIGMCAWCKKTNFLNEFGMCKNCKKAQFAAEEHMLYV